ncbi:MAG: hypothetical protein ABIO99_11255 [Candidatus Limnocylindria bacterium]
MLDAIHRLIAYAAVVITVVGIAWSIRLAFAGRGGRLPPEQFQAAVVSLLLVGSASGAILLASGARPRDGLHLLYALIALALVPLVRSFVGRAGGRGAALLLMAGFVALGAVLYRLFTTS